MSPRSHEVVEPVLRGNRFARTAWAGAFGDLGTLIPYVVVYLSMLNLGPFGVLLSFGAAMIACGLIYRTPFPVQPMKAVGAIATTQAAQTLTVTETAGAVYPTGLPSGIIVDPTLANQLAGTAIEPRLPTFALGGIGWNDALTGTVFLALPHVPLTLGNAIVAITDKTIRLFPDRPVTEQRVAVSTGLMNLGSAALGGIDVSRCRRDARPRSLRRTRRSFRGRSAERERWRRCPPGAHGARHSHATVRGVPRGLPPALIPT
jgi:hypothetical protein